MPRLRNSFLITLLIATLAVPLAALDDKDGAEAKAVRLFDGKSLSNFYTWLVDSKDKDPDKVFTVVDQIDGAPAIRVSGQHWGGLITQQLYSNYHLIVEYRWGLATWGERKNRARDSGILLHAQGPEGNYKPDFNGPWMRSVEFQIIDGGVGDLILVNGYNPEGKLIETSLTATSSKDRDGESVYDPKGPEVEFHGHRINWYGRDPDWEDRLGFRGKEDVESPEGQWTRLEAICDGNKITNIVNGKVVNVGTRSSLKEGKLLFQSEGAEILFRRIDLVPLNK
jgi:hypothetical protein